MLLVLMLLFLVLLLVLMPLYIDDAPIAAALNMGAAILIAAFILLPPIPVGAANLVMLFF